MPPSDSACEGVSSLPPSAGDAGPALASPGPATNVRHPGAYANLDPDDDAVVGPPEIIVDCEAQLAKAGVTFRPASLPVHTGKAGGITCGAPQVVTYVRGPGHIAYEPPPLLTCGMALALASYERILQEEAQRAIGSPVVRVQQLGTYNCRQMTRFKGVVSEHSYANAIDLSKFVFENGKSATVLDDFDTRVDAPTRPGGAFLRLVSVRGQDEDIFSNVLTPFWDALHKNHFHLDLARYRVNGARPAGTRFFELVHQEIGAKP